MTDGERTSVTLRDEPARLQATFLPGAGMLCCSLRHRGEELLAQNRGVEAYVARGKTMGIPLLYPWANRLAGFDYTVAGRGVTVPRDPARIALDDNGLPIHGVIGGRIAWELLHAGGASLTARLRWEESHADLFDVFPFRHDLSYEARLGGGGLEIEVTVHACGEDAVPVAFGFHPYLAPPGAPRERWRVTLPPMRSLRLDERQIPLAPGEQLPAEDFELAERQFDDGFDSLTEPARFAVQAGERRIALHFLAGYPCAQVYTPPGGAFICFEPMTAPANALRSGDGLRVLRPGERTRTVFVLRCE
ncbi:MAG TPA: aldose 1-epimerase [Solirubrobacteraceae bacterium]|jgi:aldose 1-epimerase|nr:aldose 1-epimerase [Solirubrobacteraceae bacterium]